MSAELSFPPNSSFVIPATLRRPCFPEMDQAIWSSRNQLIGPVLSHFDLGNNTAIILTLVSGTAPAIAAYQQPS